MLQHIVVIILYLAKHNLAFRGSSDKLFEPNNGNFLGLVESIAKFDPVLMAHLRRIKNQDIHDHYLGKNIQNELISIIGKKVQDIILQQIKKAKYYSVIFDCTPDVSHACSVCSSG